MKAFEAKNIVKYFGSVKALDGVTLSVDQGKVFGFLGPNGAGKTTLIRILCTLLKPDKGTAKVQGIDVIKDPQKVRESIGLAGQYAAVDEYMTGRENMHMVGRLYHLSRLETKKRTERILQELRLAEFADRQVGTYSGGMRRRLDLGASLVGHPKVLFLDEPTTGLDPRTRLELWGIIKDLEQSGTGIILTTQYLEEVDELADKIAVIDQGKIIAEGTSNELKRKIGGEVVEIELAGSKDQQKALRLGEKLSGKPPKPTESGYGVYVTTQNGSKTLLKAVDLLNKSKIKPKSVSLHKPSLDNVFLTLTGRPADPQEKLKSKGGKK